MALRRLISFQFGQRWTFRPGNRCSPLFKLPAVADSAYCFYSDILITGLHVGRCMV